MKLSRLTLARCIMPLCTGIHDEHKRHTGTANEREWTLILGVENGDLCGVVEDGDEGEEDQE